MHKIVQSEKEDEVCVWWGFPGAPAGGMQILGRVGCVCVCECGCAQCCPLAHVVLAFQSYAAAAAAAHLVFIVCSFDSP